MAQVRGSLRQRPDSPLRCAALPPPPLPLPLPLLPAAAASWRTHPPTSLAQANGDAAPASTKAEFLSVESILEVSPSALMQTC